MNMSRNRAPVVFIGYLDYANAPHIPFHADCLGTLAYRFGTGKDLQQMSLHEAKQAIGALIDPAYGAEIRRRERLMRQVGQAVEVVAV